MPEQLKRQLVSASQIASLGILHRGIRSDGTREEREKERDVIRVHGREDGVRDDREEMNGWREREETLLGRANRDRETV